MEQAQAHLTDDQAAMYDRQLRVWGVEVQRKLTAAKVLVAGLGKLAAEIAKNIVLAGVGNVALLDDAPASVFGGNSFLVTTATPPKASMAQAAAATLQAMNPLVSVTAVPGPASSCSALDVVKGYDLVIVTGQPLAVMQQADAACQQAGAGFMAASVRAFSSFLFLDLGAHTYRPKAAPDAKQQQPEEQTQRYPSMHSALSVPLPQLPAGSHPLYSVLAACSAFERQHSRQPGPGDAQALVAWLQAAGAVEQDVADELSGWLSGAAGGAGAEFAPLCAVTGGVAANNVVKAVSHSGAPLVNLFYYSLFDGRGVVELRGEEVVQAKGNQPASAKDEADVVHLLDD